jgi:hemerythrin-like domain-containing protein
VLLGSLVRTQGATFRSLHAYLAWDHHRLDGVLAEVVKKIEDGDVPHALRSLGHYDRGQRRHIRIEEETVFQLYAFERTGAARSPKQVMEAEHAQILKELEAMQAALEHEDVATFRAAHARLSGILKDHHRREEEELYPYIDSLLGAAEAEKLVARLRAE